MLKKVNKKGLESIMIVFVLCVIFVILFFIFTIFGLHIKTTEGGKHTGYVTAVETNGIIFKTHSIYFKSDLESSQEDRYCVIDLSLKEELEKTAKDKTRITIYYYNYLFPGWNYCKMGDISIVDAWNVSPGETE